MKNEGLGSPWFSFLKSNVLSCYQGPPNNDATIIYNKEEKMTTGSSSQGYGLYCGHVRM